jgi:hypothetical protein
MKKSKFIEDEKSIQIKKNLLQLEQKVNPKPYTREEIEIRKQGLRDHQNKLMEGKNE